MHDVSSAGMIEQSEVENKNIAKRLKFDRPLSAIADFQVKDGTPSIRDIATITPRLKSISDREGYIARRIRALGDDKSQSH